MKLETECVAKKFSAAEIGEFIRTSTGEIGIVGNLDQEKVLLSFTKEGLDEARRISVAHLPNNESILSFGRDICIRFNPAADAKDIVHAGSAVPLDALRISEHGVSIIARRRRDIHNPVEIFIQETETTAEFHSQACFHVMSWQITRSLSNPDVAPLFSFTATDR